MARRNQNYCYRGVNPEVHQQLLAIAKDLTVPLYQVAGVFAEYSISCIERGELQIKPCLEPEKHRMKIDWQEASWNQKSTPLSPKKQTKKRDKKSDRRKCHSYYMPEEIHEYIRQTAINHNVCQGDVVSFLFAYSLRAYENGKLLLKSQPAGLKMRLTRIRK